MREQRGTNFVVDYLRLNSAGLASQFHRLIQTSFMRLSKQLTAEAEYSDRQIAAEVGNVGTSLILVRCTTDTLWLIRKTSIAYTS